MNKKIYKTTETMINNEIPSIARELIKMPYTDQELKLRQKNQQSYRKKW